MFIIKFNKDGKAVYRNPLAVYSVYRGEIINVILFKLARDIDILELKKSKTYKSRLILPEKQPQIFSKVEYVVVSFWKVRIFQTVWRKFVFVLFVYFERLRRRSIPIIRERRKINCNSFGNTRFERHFR